jgi:hypothetical protein
MWYPNAQPTGHSARHSGIPLLSGVDAATFLPMAGQRWGASVGFRAVRPGSKMIQWTQRLFAVITAIGAILTLTVLATRADLGGRALAIASTLLIIGALSFSGMWLWLRNVRLLIGQREVGYRNFFGLTRFWSGDGIAHVVSMAVSYRKSSTPLRGIYCFGPDGRRLLALNESAWPPEDMKAFIEATGRPLDFRDAPITAKDARREFPNAFGWDTEHITLMTILTMLGAALLAVAGYTIVFKVLFK